MVKLNLALAAGVLSLSSATASSSSSSSASSSSGHAQNVRGVAPSDAHRYVPYTTPATGQQRWKCLDGSKDIKWSAVNDDYCDCPDGSDEPGTSACPNASFYCHNNGHIPARIRSSRVNDGICDPECCDGSDETDGKVHCPDRCAKVGKEHRKRMAELENVRRAGAKIREKYIADGRKERESLESEVAKLEVEIEVAREREHRLKQALEAAESMDKAVIEAKLKTPLYATLTDHQSAMKALLDKNAKLKEELKTLTLLLDDLARGYNPNYQDMAVKGAVVAYKQWRGIDTSAAAAAAAKAEADEQGVEVDKDADINADNVKVRELFDDGDWSADKVHQLASASVLELMDGGLGGSGDPGAVSDADNGLLFRIHEYLPDPVVPYFEAMVDTLLDVLIKANVIKDVKRMRPKGAGGSGDGAEPDNVAEARRAHADAGNQLRRIEGDLSSYRNKLDHFGEKYGRQLEFRALENKCVQKDLGEYTYEYCFFGRIKQIPNKYGAQVTLGNFANWNPAGNATPDQDDYWRHQIYANGQRCWNGPVRSAIVDLVCDTTNALLDVFEAEKCIYSVKVSTPAVCFPPASASSSSGSGSGLGSDSAPGSTAPKTEHVEL
ncbi:uncharacterized protein PFL1_04864 [Pseudozyma flocculosa PF-1]|uniref:Glucosidase 2 subunit beta n=2 Tax=Pseudozyma flocculosa TaxID=84751 RepID=A0A5C3F3Q6_9BASI|nr:uncharacterized protein PFL1_04864 [Pseudozyma flocculosa PF-1]EPQ27727.1 hypothetical protein PFL1_04864 [Pseudozyma flocculosa PF-1]SPO39134.1 related to alpha glucosidase II beta subunit [Pseudozyma flocculosa]